MTTTSSHIFLENVRFYAYHGVAPQETLVGNEFIINLSLKVDFGKAATTDEVADTVSYADVYAVLKEEMANPSKLLEHVCRRIVQRLFHDFRDIEEVSIRLAKRTPPMGADIDSAGVEMSCKNRNRSTSTKRSLKEKALITMGIIVLLSISLLGTFSLPVGCTLCGTIGLIYGIIDKNKAFICWSSLALLIGIVMVTHIYNQLYSM